MMIHTSVSYTGFEGILFPGDGKKEYVMIVVSGSNGGLTLTRQCAEFYHRNGIPALALALFATKGTQPFLDRVPLEYAESAIAWLKKQGYEKIGIDGMSKGSEFALVAASRFSGLSCVIARVPSHFVSEGLTGRGKAKGPSGTSCWSYRGEQLSFAPYRIRKFNVPKILLREKEMHIIDFNRDKEVSPECRIPMDQIRAPILLLSSKRDSVWPSYESASYMEQTLSEIGFPYSHKHIAFDFMSHAMLTELPPLYRLAFATERQNPRQCAEERERLKLELLSWVRETWS